MSSTKLSTRVQSPEKIKNLSEAPDLLEVQIQSFTRVFPVRRPRPISVTAEGLFKVFKENFPHYGHTGTSYSCWEFLDYFIDSAPATLLKKCMERGLNIFSSAESETAPEL